MNINIKKNFVHIDVTFEEGVSVLDGITGEGKTFLIKSIYEYCLSVGIDVLYISYENSLETDLIKSACCNKKIILFDNADLYMTDELFRYLKSLNDTIVIVAMKHSFLFDSFDCKSYRVEYNGKDLRIENW